MCLDKAYVEPSIYRICRECMYMLTCELKATALKGTCGECIQMDCISCVFLKRKENEGISKQIIMSIKPTYVDKILNGTKKYEYRRRIAALPIDYIYIYCTHPTMKVVAKVEVVGIVASQPFLLWEKTKDNSGISYHNFMEYFSGNNIAYAYQLGKVEEFKPHKELIDFGVKKAPQSFVYLNL